MAGDDFVTSGTHIESLCYSALWTNDMNETLNGEARHVFRTRSMVAIDMHMMYYLETWPYDHVLYLPGKSDENLDRRLDFSIRDGLAMLQIDHYTLDGENRAEQAIEYIRSKREPTNTTE